jgi:hypothetical protein
MKLQRHTLGVQATGGVQAIGGLRSIRNFVATSVAFVVLILGMASLVIWNARERAFNQYQVGITAVRFAEPEFPKHRGDIRDFDGSLLGRI